MAKKADAWKEYKEAAMVDMMLQTLPKVKKMYAYTLQNPRSIKTTVIYLLRQTPCFQPHMATYPQTQHFHAHTARLYM